MWCALCASSDLQGIGSHLGAPGSTTEVSVWCRTQGLPRARLRELPLSADLTVSHLRLWGYDPGGGSTCCIGPSRRPSVCPLSLHTPWKLEGLWLGKLNPRYSPAYICVVLSSAHVDKGLHFGESRGKELGKNCHETFRSKTNLLCLECEIYVHE